MSNLLLFHKMLTPELMNKVGYQSQPTTGSYFVENEEIEIKLVPFDEGHSSYKIEDPRVVWDPSIHEITFSKRSEIPHPQFLFGSKGLVDKEHEIGIALRWFSKDSSLIKVREVRSFSINDTYVDISIQETIKAGVLRGKIVLEVLMTDRKTGRILGVLSNQTIVLDGNSSLFPIQEVHYKGEPLWWITRNYSDPLVDEFDLSNISISLNFAHKHARHLKLDKGINSSPLLLEIIASALEVIINDVMTNSEWETIMNGESDPGSIGAVIHYFINTFGWDISTPALLAKSIRENLGEKF